jgi:hypothetical protein
VIAAIDKFGRRCVAWPMALAGLALCFIAEGLIRSAAWIAGVDVEDEDAVL